MTTASSSAPPVNSTIRSSHKQQPASSGQTSNTSCPTPSVAFQQVKQTQASLARLCRVQQQQQQQQCSQNNQTSQNQPAKTVPEGGQPRPTTFIDCLIRRFKNCFDEDFCTVPMFVVGNLSPGSDGTHLILPPCVSLGGQNISRFSSPKNLRLINSIRESCRSIEDLDLGGNKLTDLIEVYKILQCTPNLKFLNLSENDLSRTSPVAMAAASMSTLSSSNTHHHQPSSSGCSPAAASLYSASQTNRTYLAPINQNQSTSVVGRRHSTLGESSSPVATSISSRPSISGSANVARQRHTASRVAEARRIAAANALAQSKKTSSSVANKIANSANVRGRPVAGASAHRGQADASISGSNGSRSQQSSSSTMQLARSLSSLSAKDIRTSTSRLMGPHRVNCRKESSLRSSCSARASTDLTAQKSSIPSSSHAKQQVNSKSSCSVSGPSSSRAMFDDAIAESDDVDMSADQQHSSNQQQSAGAATAPDGQSGSQSQSTGSKVSAIHTGNSNLVSSNTNWPTSRMSFMCSQSPTLTSGQSQTFRRTFESIRALALNNTGCQWRVVCSILSRMPNLEELHLSLNNYERIDLDPNEFRHASLKRLYLCNNPKLTSWEELDKLLIAFPSLEALSIADCNISQIPDNLDRAREWRKLCGLNINGWPIKEWPVVERLNQLPSLVDLKCRNLEVLNSIDEPRQHLIARLPRLQRLNGSEIEEREDAEKAFLRFFMANSHLERPPRFHELIQIHGEVASTSIDVDVDLSPPSQAQVRVIFLNRDFYRKENEDVLLSEDFLVKLMDNVDSNGLQVQQESGDISQEIMDSTDEMANEEARERDEKQVARLFKDESQEVVAIKVDLRQSVRKFKSVLASLFGLEDRNLILYYIDHEMVGLMGPELIKHNQKKLWNYNVQDGDQFIVEER